MCTRATYLGPNDIVITGRSLDWMAPMGTNLWAFPAGMRRDGAAGPRSLAWTSDYGSLVASGYDGATVEGINERGLVVSMLYLAEANYGAAVADDPRPRISVAAWAQYALDNFATVAEAVAALRDEPFTIGTLMTPDGAPATVHLALTDPSGDSAIFEYIDGKLRIHHGRQYQVMTNSPAYDEQLALTAYWGQIGGDVMLPGTSRAADRFVRASYYLGVAPQTDDNVKALASAFSIIRNASAPLGVATPDQPNIASTLWRSVVDLQNKVYYFESAESPNLIWIDLADLDVAPGAPVMKLTLNEASALVRDGSYVAGDAAPFFEPAAPFAFLPVAS